MVSNEEVRDFYERMPYPPPLTTLEDHRALYKNPMRRTAQFHLLWPTEPLRENLEILIAGCGTSQASHFFTPEECDVYSNEPQQDRAPEEGHVDAEPPRPANRIGI